MVNCLLLGCSLVAGTASMAEDYSHLPGRIATAGDDRLG